MTQISIINTEIILSFNQTPTIKTKHSKTQTFFNSKFNPQIVKVGNSDKCLFLKSSSEMINNKPIISKMVNFNHFTFEMGAASSNNAIESSNKIWHSDGRSDSSKSYESGRFNASLLAPKASSFIRDSFITVRKPADVHGHVGSANAASDLDFIEMMDIMEGERLVIEKYDVNSQLEQRLLTEIAVEEISSWFELAGRVFRIWQTHSAGHDVMELLGKRKRIPRMSPADCWPGRRTVFGRMDGDKFTDLSWCQDKYDWMYVRVLINCVRVFAQAPKQQQ